MSYVAKTYEFIDKLQKLFNKKLFNTCFIAIASMVLFFGVMNVYAQETSPTGTVDVSNVSVSPDWTGIQAFINLANGTEKTEDNMGSQGSLSIANTTYTALAVIAPGVTAGAEEIESDPDVPQDMKNGLMGFADSAITYAYVNYPSSSISDHLAQEWVPGYKDSTTSTYAADETNKSGYDTLMSSGIAPLWNKVRNLAYVFFVVIMIVVGFMIMFRSKIGGQTLVSLGNFIPGVITSLILITFSFAIAGLLIDIGGIVTSLIASIYDGNVVGINSIWKIFWSLFTGGPATTTAGLGIAGVLTLLAKAGIVAIAGASAAPIVATVGILALLLALVIVAVIFVGGIKVLITLYKAFFGILLGVVVGPIQIMIGAFPGKGYSTSNWFKSLLKNVLTFPMVFAIVNLPTFIASQTGINLSLPEKLSYATNDGMNLNLTEGDTGTGAFLVMFILRIVVLYFAAESPKYLEAWFPSDTPKPVAEGLANAKASLSKIPLVGGLFK